MTSYVLTIHQPPWSYLAVKTACEFAEQIVQQGHKLSAIFLYQDGVFNGLTELDISSDELNGQQALLALKAKASCPILLCVTAAEKRGICEGRINAQFTLSGLAEFAEFALAADKVVQFK